MENSKENAKPLGLFPPPPFFSMSSFFSSRMQMGWLAQQLSSCNHKGRTKETRDLKHSDGLELGSQCQILPARGLAVGEKSVQGASGRVTWADGLVSLLLYAVLRKHTRGRRTWGEYREDT